MKKKTLLTSLMALGMLLPLAGCDSEANVIVVSGPEGAKDFITAKFDAWKATNEKYGDYTLQYAVYGENEVDSKVTDWTAKAAPDVYAFASDKIQPLFKAGALAQVPTGYATGIKNSMTDAGIGASEFAGKTYAYPYAGDNGYYLFYNTDYFNATDVETWEGITAKAATHAGKMISYNATEAFYGAGIMFTFGASYDIDFTATGDIASISADFDGANGLLAAKALYDITHNPQWQASQAVTDGDPLILCVDGAWSVSSHKETLGDKLAFAKLPTITVGDRTENLGSFLGCKLYGVNPQKFPQENERLAALHALTNYLVSEEVQKDRFDSFSIAPTNKAAAASDAVQADPAVVAINEQAKYATAQTAVPGGIWSGFGAFAEGIRDLAAWSESAAQGLLDTLNQAVKTVS